MQENHPNFYAIIPANVRYHKNLEPSAKLLYGEITALCNSQGFCWATNKYLADLYDVDERTIKRWISSLSDAGFIFIEIDQNGFQTRRRIFISKEIKEMFTAGQKCPGGGTKVSSGGDKNVTHNNTMNITSNKIHTQKPEKIVEVPKKKDVCDFLSFGSHVKLTQSEYDILCHDLGKKEVDEIIIEMNDYCKSQGKAYKSYEATIRVWIRKNKNREKKPGLNAKSSTSKDVAVEVRKNYSSKFYEIIVDDTQISFCPTQGQQLPESIKFTEYGFSDKVTNMLNKKRFIRKKE